MYEAKNFEHLIGLEGFSEKALRIHFKLYEGYVKNTNVLSEQLDRMSNEGDFGPKYAELKRRFGWEFNGMRLHEYHFGAMSLDAEDFDEGTQLGKKIIEDFGSYEKWASDFRATAKLRGIGWAILYYDSKADRLFNTWIDEHALGHLAGEKVILNLDVFEHAYIIDHGTNRDSYVDAFLKATNWEVVCNRFEQVRSQASAVA